jgi:uncharacterized membrane protein YraQ (UPF0718 family)
VPLLRERGARGREDEHRHGIRDGGPPRRRTRWLAFGVAGIVLLFVLRAVTSRASIPLPNQVQDFLTLTISVIIESLPFVILGILLSIVVQLWVPDDLFVRVLPKTPMLRRLAISVLGVLLPVCECGNVPLARGLIVKGLTVAESMTFLLAAPIVNPITIITTAQAFGWTNGILIARLAGGFLIANLVGWLFAKHSNQFGLLTDRFAAECRVPVRDTDGRLEDRWKKSVDLFVHEAGSILPALFLGAVAAGLVQVVVPRQVLVTLGSNPVWSILAMMVLAFVISVCSNVDAFFILPFATTFLPGSIVSFLVFGPLIDIKMLALMRTTFRARVLLQLTIIVALAAALVGLVVNFVA